MQGTVSTWVYTQSACATLTELFEHGLNTFGMCVMQGTVSTWV